MIELVKWGIPTPIGERTYYPESIILPQSMMSDIMAVNLNIEYSKIGDCTLVKNEIGLYANNIKYNIDVDYLNTIIKHYKKGFKNLDILYRSELAMASIGFDQSDYKNDTVEFKFVQHLLLTKEDIKAIVRDLKLNTCLT